MAVDRRHSLTGRRQWVGRRPLAGVVEAWVRPRAAALVPRRRLGVVVDAACRRLGAVDAACHRRGRIGWREEMGR